MLKIDINRIRGDKKISCKGSFNKSEITALYGRSGSGKTSILRMIAGLDNPDSGWIEFNKDSWFDKDVITPIHKRAVGIVFQDYNLFRHMTIESNLEFANDNKLDSDLLSLADTMGVSELFDRYPHELSQGQKQKVAILRSLCLNNEVLLLDEPFSALDDESILEIIYILNSLKKEKDLIIVLVTHRKDVILRMADSVLNIETGEQGSPKSLIQKTI